MSKCGKSCMPECEYFTTGGCISPFNCQYKIETGYINSATSIPTYMEKQMSMTAEEIEHCLERFTMGKTTDVMNFDYAGTLAYIQRLKAENAALRERFGKAIILPCKLGDKLYFVNKYLATPKIQEHYITAIEIFPSYVKLYVEDGGYFILDGDNVYFNPEAAKARLAELKGEEK